MELPRYLWIKGRKYLLYEVIDDCDYENCKKYLHRLRNRNGTRFYIRTFQAQNTFWLPETKHAVYLDKTITLNKNNRSFDKHPNDHSWENTMWG